MGKWTFVLAMLRQSHTTNIHFLLGLCLWKVLTKKWDLNISEPGCCGISRETATFEKILKGMFRLRKRRY